MTMLIVRDYVDTVDGRTGVITAVGDDVVEIAFLTPDGDDWEAPVWLPIRDVVHLHYHLNERFERDDE